MTPPSGGRSAQPGLMPLQTATMMRRTLHLQSPARLLSRPSQQISSSASARLSWMKIQTAMRTGMRPKGLQVGTHPVGVPAAALHPPELPVAGRLQEDFVICSCTPRCWPDLL